MNQVKKIFFTFFIYPMKKKNKFIATFMNSKHANMSIHKAKDYKYHNSWNWLMPVVDKINSMYYNNELYVFAGIVEKMREYVADVNIEGTFNMVIEFIHFYNKLNDKNTKNKNSNN